MDLSKLIRFATLVLLLLLMDKAFAQTDTDNRKENWKYFKGYTNDQKDIIINNWDQYFQKDIYKKLAPSVDLFSIKFDSYGSLYPDMELFKDFTKEDFDPVHRDDTDNLKYSMFDIFKNNKEKLLKSAKSLPDVAEQKFYTQLLKKSMSYSEDSTFYGPWDRYHLKNTLDALNAKIAKKQSEGKKVRVVFFIHGYNVPYSLGNIQAIELIKLLARNEIDTSNIVFVPVFWSSHAGKAHSIGDSASFCTENFSHLNDGGLENGFGFWYYSNRAYFAGIGLRKLINGIASSDAEIIVFSHSLGATIVTTALINTYSKLDTKFQREGFVDAQTFFNSCNDRMRNDEPANYSIMDEMLKVPLPDKKVRVFMSAAAIPGYNTFRDMDVTCRANCTFYIPINQKDEMLNKSILPLGIGSPLRFGVTTLGLNYEDDAIYTQQNCFKDHISNFNYLPFTSNNTDHDILTYMRQTGYVNYVLQFFR